MNWHVADVDDLWVALDQAIDRGWSRESLLQWSRDGRAWSVIQHKSWSWKPSLPQHRAPTAPTRSSDGGRSRWWATTRSSWVDQECKTCGREWPGRKDRCS